MTKRKQHSGSDPPRRKVRRTLSRSPAGTSEATGVHSADLLTLCRSVVGRSPLAVAITEGESHRLRCVNSAFHRLADAPSETLVDRPFAEAFPESRADGSLALLDQVWRTGEAERIPELEHRRSGRGAVFWSYTVWPVTDSEQRPTALFVVISDATEHVLGRRARDETAGQMREINERLLVAGVREQELAEQAELHSVEMDALLESLNDGVAVIDAGGRITLMNPAGRAIFRVPAGEDARAPEEHSRADFRRLDGKPLPFEQWPIARALRGERFTQDEVILERADGSRRRVAFSGSAIRDDAGQVTRAIVIFRDVTELRELEEMKDQFTGLISHDLRSPLHAILGHAQLLRQTLTETGRQQEAGQAAVITKGAKQMNAMIQDLQESVRLESGKFEVRKRLGDLRYLVSEAVRRLDPEDRTRIRIEAPQRLPRVPADPDRLGRVITNFLTNALKYSSPGSPVTVRLERRGSEAVVSVIDRGVGISRENLRHVFDRFYRAKTGAKVGGLGLGLYISRLIVEAHGGRIRAESEPRKGSTFSFSLPIE